MALPKTTLRRDHLRNVIHKYADTTHYIAIMVTISFLIQLWWMTKGHG